MSVAASNHYFTNHMYAAPGVLSPEERGDGRPSTRSFQLPGLGCHPPRRSGREAKIGFVPAGDPQDLSDRWDEGGFLLHLSL
ncbi:hypothetical protein DL768_011511 [Monosporascus sp. mg162]|nr:hypothetical protein DL768_011511 [Monosporascus sp. mg162]